MSAPLALSEVLITVVFLFNMLSTTGVRRLTLEFHGVRGLPKRFEALWLHLPHIHSAEQFCLKATLVTPSATHK